MAAPEEDDPPTSARALAGPEYTLDGKELDTDDANCLEDTIGDVTDACTINIDTTTATFAVDGTLDSNDRLSIKIDRDKAAVDTASVIVDEGGLGGTDRQVELTFEVGRNLMRLWGDEDGSPGDSEVHFYRVNVLPYWELNGDRLSKSDDCRSTSDRTAAQITDADCIVTQFGNTAIIRFHNVINDQFNVYVHVNGTRVINEPDNTELAGSFTLDLQDGDNAVRVRLASKTGTHFSERYGNDKFHYKVETGVLVSNLGQVSSGSGLENPLANQFTTGSNPSGYIISKVGLKIAGDSGTVPRVSIYSDNSGRPGTSLKVLTNPSTIPPGPAPEDVIDFGADNYRLEPGTPYWIVVEKASGNEPMYLGRTTLTAEDPGSAAGWSIGDNGARLASGTWSTLTAIYGLAVKGTIAVSTDATLSALALTDASDNAVALVPAFASGTTSYSATVANSVSRIKVEPTANDSNAKIEYLDASDSTLDDEDTSTADVFDFDLNVGSNVVKVKVTAEDGTTTRTYTVTIRRAEADLLVSNAGNVVTEGSAGTLHSSFRGMAIQFTTGNHPGGYEVDKVRLRIAVPAGTTPRLSIYSDSSGKPGASLKTLANPSTVPTSFAWADFDVGGYRLAPSTSYWIVVERATGSGNVIFRTTESTAEDAGSAEGWSIGNRLHRLTVSSGLWSSVSGSRFIFQMIIRGGAATATTPGAPASLTASAGNAEATLTWTAPASDGGAAITKYQYRVSVDGGTTWAPDWTDVPDGSDSGSDQGDERTVTVTSLANGSLHTFQVRAVNSEGSGSEIEATATPTAPGVTPSASSDAEFTLDGQELDTTATCDEENIEDVTDDCTINIDTTTPIFAVDGTLDSNDRLTIEIGISSSNIAQPGHDADQGDLRGTDPTVTLTFPVGRSLMRLWRDEGGSPGGSEEHFYRVNVVPYWELNGDRLSKSDACRSTSDRTAAQITDADCIVTQFGNASTIRFHNVVTAQFNVYVHVNGTRVINEPDDTALADSFDLDLQDGDNAVRVRVVVSGGYQAETYGNDRFHYKVRVSPTDTLSALVLTDASDNAVALNPAFASGTASYNAKVANSVSRIKMEPTTNDSNANIEYLDASDSTLDDEDTSTADVFDFDLSVGSNVVKVKVTAEDGTTTRTYTINVIRETLNNQGATGAPTITGTASVHQTLMVETTDILDADGLTGASFSYQWIRVDPDGSESEISGAVSSTYKLTGDDEGKRLKVRVSFNDDNDNPEFLTSAATAAVSPSPCTVEGALRFNGSLPEAINVVVGDSDGSKVTLPSWSGPVCRALFYLG